MLATNARTWSDLKLHSDGKAMGGDVRDELGGVQALITIGLGVFNVILQASFHRGVEPLNDRHRLLIAGHTGHTRARRNRRHVEARQAQIGVKISMACCE